MMELKVGDHCPLLNKKCIQMECALFSKVQGTNKNTGKNVEEWGCALAWLPILMIENSGVNRETGAAVESFRNEMVKANNMNTMVSALAQRNKGNENLTDGRNAGIGFRDIRIEPSKKRSD